MGRIHEGMGVCPQFDILWPLLTVLDHLRFYLHLKGCPADEVQDRAQASAMAGGSGTRRPSSPASRAG